MNKLKCALLVSTLFVVAGAGIPALADESLRSIGSAGSGNSASSTTSGTLPAAKSKAIGPIKLRDDEMSRDLPDLDPKEMERDLGTVGHSRSGSDTRQPASDAMKKILQQSDTSDPAFADSGDRQVFGDDDRVQVTATSDFPFRVFGMLQGKTPSSGKLGDCSATLIGPRTVLTAAHCVYDHEENGWMQDLVFAPALNGYSDAPFGVIDYDTAYVFEGFLSNYKTSYNDVVPWDIAVVILKEPIGNQLGWLPYGYDKDPAAFQANVVGYPGDKPEGTMWRTNCDVTTDNIDDTNFLYQCDTFPGSSGSSVYDYNAQTKDRTVLGINVAESKTTNVAVRINEVYFNWLKGLVQ